MNPHMVMIGPLVVLATLSVIGGFPGVPPKTAGFIISSIRLQAWPVRNMPLLLLVMFGLMGTATVIALLGWGLAHYFYCGPPLRRMRWPAECPAVYDAAQQILCR